MLLIGNALKPQGIRGEIKILPLLDEPADFCKIKKIIIKDTTYQVEKTRLGGEFIYVKLLGVNDRNVAETLRGDVYVDDANRPKISKDRYYIADLLGAKIVCDGEKLGVLREILQNGSADVYCVKGKKDFMFPFIDGVIIDVDLDAKEIYLDKENLEKVAVYED